MLGFGLERGDTEMLVSTPHITEPPCRLLMINKHIPLHHIDDNKPYFRHFSRVSWEFTALLSTKV